MFKILQIVEHEVLCLAILASDTFLAHLRNPNIEFSGTRMRKMIQFVFGTDTK